LKTEINGPVVILRSADASNLKAVIKQIIRDTTSQKPGIDNDEEIPLVQDSRKLLSYDLEILHGFVRAHRSQAVVIAFQDSEAFDNSIVAELVILFRYVIK
jgi:origin recognition complex subunit 3